KAMKKVGGRLRLDMAQYRELEVFSKFGAELDKSTLALLSRGERMVEILKQKNFEPLPVEKQVALIYAGGNGYLDDVPVSSVSQFEQKLYEFLDAKRPEVLAGIRQHQDLTDEVKRVLDDALAAFKLEFAEVSKRQTGGGK
ncbi:MAG: F0F1 ATP synthase subunit alpha, partial [Proteobacteria bacterium]|nr:F0F1 ATP synthase subunit alpha [Pseudomonadota bacterium]